MSAMYLNETSDRSLARMGAAAPDFTLKTGQGDEWRLSDHLGQVVVLLFYPQNETLVCTRQLCSVRDNWEDYLETKAVIVGISAATATEQQAFSERRRLPLELLSDTGRQVTRLYSRHWLYPLSLTRAVVVIDAKGVIRTRDVMLRMFRPTDAHLITEIYSARGDALTERYDQLKKRMGPSRQA